MPARKIAILVLVTSMLMFSLGYFNSASSEDKKFCQLLPEELLELAKQKGYDQVTDFYMNRHGMINPMGLTWGRTKVTI